MRLPQFDNRPSSFVIPEVTLNAGVIIVCDMFTYPINNEYYTHDPQTIYKKYTDILIAKHVGVKPYA